MCMGHLQSFIQPVKSSFGWDITCFGPMVVYVNGEVAYKSDIFKERYSETSTRVLWTLKKVGTTSEFNSKRQRRASAVSSVHGSGKWGYVHTYADKGT